MQHGRQDCHQQATSKQSLLVSTAASTATPSPPDLLLAILQQQFAGRQAGRQAI
jgi:hypothetical protein